MTEEYQYPDEDEVEYYAVRPNKTRIKRDLAQLFALAEEMVALSSQQLKNLELQDKLHNSITEVSTMAPTGARKRLLKYITAQLHKMDVSPILEKLARIKTQSAHVVREHHIAERWRDQLVKDGNNALVILLDEQPQLDRQHLRQLTRNAQKEAELGKPPKSARLLYRYLKESLVADEELETEFDADFVDEDFEDVDLEEDMEDDDESLFPSQLKD
jgi:ribosome-associated protein